MTVAYPGGRTSDNRAVAARVGAVRRRGPSGHPPHMSDQGGADDGIVRFKD